LVIPPALPVAVLFGSAPAAGFAFLGEAPGIVAGVLQININIPTNAASGNAVPLMVAVGTANTQSGITVAIK
jgi:uncharacterized protein (TIGR03437 family)